MQFSAVVDGLRSGLHVCLWAQIKKKRAADRKVAILDKEILFRATVVYHWTLVSFRAANQAHVLVR